MLQRHDMKPHYYEQRNGWRVEIWRNAEHQPPFVTEHEASTRAACEAFAASFLTAVDAGQDVHSAHRLAAAAAASA